MTTLRTGSAEEAGFLPERLDIARRLLRAHVASGRTPTLVAAVARNGVIAFSEAVGQQGPGGPAADIAGILPVASLSKPITATLIMCLVEDGEVGIHSRVVDYIPELAAGDNDDVLVHHLLTHTHGWDEEVLRQLTVQRHESGALGPVPADGDVLKHFWLNPGWDAPRTYAAGEVMVYGNYSFQLLGEIVARVSGSSLDAFARSRLFEPLGMTSTAYVLTDEMRPHLLHRPPGIPHGPDQEFPFGGPYFEATQHGAAGVYSSAHDMVAFGQMILNGGRYGAERILSRPAVETMTSDRIPGTPAQLGAIRQPDGGYGYGWLVRNHIAWRYFSGGLVPYGSVAHPGSGGTGYWIDFQHGIVGFCAEFATVLSPDSEPFSWVENRFEDVITSAIAD